MKNTPRSTRFLETCLLILIGSILYGPKIRCLLRTSMWTVLCSFIFAFLGLRITVDTFITRERLLREINFTEYITGS